MGLSFFFPQMCGGFMVKFFVFFYLSYNQLLLSSQPGARYHALLIPNCPGAVTDLANSGYLAKILQHFSAESSRWTSSGTGGMKQGSCAASAGWLPSRGSRVFAWLKSIQNWEGKGCLQGEKHNGPLKKGKGDFEKIKYPRMSLKGSLKRKKMCPNVS